MTVRCGRGWVGYCNGEEVAGMGIGTEGGMVIGPQTSTTTVNDATTLVCRVRLNLEDSSCSPEVDGDATPNHLWYSTRGNVLLATIPKFSHIEASKQSRALVLCFDRTASEYEKDFCLNALQRRALSDG
ncbi:hypothetical protein ARMGADRAFT_1029382 [Armillaria gallica]|uniref:Uncharacterized protein n=1 Tax=Armillaria gallica TaxID=47427 RepID=A0A2H3DG79_ARMGA|nr:hypothetical protein ARMGADRAFT_1029382 [Armillaria gallica]